MNIIDGDGGGGVCVCVCVCVCEGHETFVQLSQCDKVVEQHRGYVLSMAGIMCS